MKTRVQRWGNSLAIRIPRPVADEAGLTEGAPVVLSVEGGAVVVRRQKLDLEALLARVTPENVHGEIDTGSPVGREVW